MQRCSVSVWENEHASFCAGVIHVLAFVPLVKADEDKQEQGVKCWSCGPHGQGLQSPEPYMIEPMLDSYDAPKCMYLFMCVCVVASTVCFCLAIR